MACLRSPVALHAYDEFTDSDMDPFNDPGDHEELHRERAVVCHPPFEQRLESAFTFTVPDTMSWPPSPSPAPGIATSGRNASSNPRAPSSPDVPHSLFQRTQAVRSELHRALGSLDLAQALSSSSALTSIGRPGDTIVSRAGPSSRGNPPSMLPEEVFLLRSDLQHLDKALQLMPHETPTKQSLGISDVSPPSNLQPLRLTLPSPATGNPPSTPTRSASPPTPVRTGPNSMQCSGMNKSRGDARCGRKVRIPPERSPKDPIHALYCYLHTAQAAAYPSPPPSTRKAPVPCSGRKNFESGGQPEYEDEVAISSTLASKDPLFTQDPYSHGDQGGTSPKCESASSKTTSLTTPTRTTNNASTYPSPPSSVRTGPRSVQCSGTKVSRGGGQCGMKVKISTILAKEDYIPPQFCYLHRNQATVPSPEPALCAPKRGAGPRIPSVSAPTSASSSLVGTTIVCSAESKAGCKMRVSIPDTHAHVVPMPALRCPKHCSDMLRAQKKFYIRREGCNDKLVDTRDYIPEWLQPATQMALRVEMEKPPSPADTPGYIYAYEIRDPLAPDVLQLKVGRTASNINERLAQWDKQCPSKETITRGIWPEPIASKGRDTFFSLLKHNIPQKNLKPGIYHRRVERLAHIELRDLAEYAPYLSSEKSSNITLRSPAQACTDCGKVHKEIFTFRLAEDGKYKGAEWQKLVKPVIERWGRFVEEYDA